MKHSIAILLLIGLVSVDCRNKGCTDPLSPDFDAKAIKDNGSCTYDGRLIIWFDELSSDNMENLWINSLSVYVDGSLVGTIAVDEWTNGQPNCSNGGGVRATVNTDGADSKLVQYTVQDDLGFTIQHGTVTVSNSNCAWVEVVY